MAYWELFEKECVDYLNGTYGKYAKFILQGGANSNVADILVQCASGETFYMEAKHSPAPSGQFVLLPDIQTNTFKYSEKNAIPINQWSRIIISHMNKSFDKYRTAGTHGKEIILTDSQAIFSNWIIQSYKHKNVKFFITNNYNIVPIEQFANYFTITATYRIKRSSSSSIGMKRINKYAKLLLETKSPDYQITDIRIEGNKLFVSSEINLHNIRFKDKIYEYMFSERNNEYEVRRLSNTYNANVIFSIEFNDKMKGISDTEFISYLR